MHTMPAWRGRVVARRVVAVVCRCECSRLFALPEGETWTKCLGCWCTEREVRHVEPPRPPLVLVELPPAVVEGSPVVAWLFERRESRRGK